jgi:mutator family transposase
VPIFRDERLSLYGCALLITAAPLLQTSWSVPFSRYWKRRSPSISVPLYTSAPRTAKDAAMATREGSSRSGWAPWSFSCPTAGRELFSTQLFARYQRKQKALALALMEMYVEGVSTSKVGEVTEELCDTSFSKSLIIELAGKLDSELEEWRNRPLEVGSYPYLFVDARYEKVRVASRRVVSEGVLVVTAVRADGLRKIVAVEVAATESEVTYQGIFRYLKARGLKGVELVVSDDHKASRRPSSVTFRRQAGKDARSITRGTSSRW